MPDGPEGSKRVEPGARTSLELAVQPGTSRKRNLDEICTGEFDGKQEIEYQTSLVKRSSDAVRYNLPCLDGSLDWLRNVTRCIDRELVLSPNDDEISRYFGPLPAGYECPSNTAGLFIHEESVMPRHPDVSSGNSLSSGIVEPANLNTHAFEEANAVTSDIAPSPEDNNFSDANPVRNRLHFASLDLLATAPAAPWSELPQTPNEALPLESVPVAATGPAAATNPTSDAERRERRRLSARRINAQGQAARKELGKEGEHDAAKLLKAYINNTGRIDWDKVMESARGILSDRFLAMEGARRALQIILSEIRVGKNVVLRVVAVLESAGLLSAVDDVILAAGETVVRTGGDSAKRWVEVLAGVTGLVGALEKHGLRLDQAVTFARERYAIYQAAAGCGSV